MIQEGKQHVLMAAQALQEPPHVSVPGAGLGLQERHQALVDALPAPVEDVVGQVAARLEPHTVAEQPLELLGKALPRGRPIVRVHPRDFAEQVRQARLAIGTEDGIVRRPKSVTSTPSKCSWKNRSNAGEPRVRLML